MRFLLPLFALSASFAVAEARPGEVQDAEAGVLVERMKAAIRQDAGARFAGHCGGLNLPDSAFLPIEVTGGGPAAIAVLFARAQCPLMGATGFSSTGGSLVQVWGAADAGGPARLLIEAHMEGFTPGEGRLVTLQHGGHCGVAGALGCRVVYGWRSGRFVEVERVVGRWDGSRGAGIVPAG